MLIYSTLNLISTAAIIMVLGRVTYYFAVFRANCRFLGNLLNSAIFYRIAISSLTTSDLTTSLYLASLY